MDDDDHHHTSSSHHHQSTKLETARECAALLMAGRAVDEAGKTTKCETGIVAYGTEETEHEILNDMQGDDDALSAYQHMRELKPLEPIHSDGIAMLYALPPSSLEGDVLSGR